MYCRLSTAQVARFDRMIKGLPHNSGMLSEVKTFLVGPTRLGKSEATNLVRIRLSSPVHVDDRTASKQVVYCTILKNLSDPGIESEKEAGVSVVDLTIDTLADKGN